MTPSTRTEARSAGAKHFYNGKPCPRGHISLRFTSTGNCCECNKERSRIANMSEEQRLRKNALAVPSPNAGQNWRNFYSRNSRSEVIRARENQLKRLLRVPSWSERELIRQFYKDCPEEYEVDHIIPLQGETVSGLHVLANLQYLLVLNNRRKGNKLL